MKTKINTQNISVTVIDNTSDTTLHRPEEITTIAKNFEDVGSIACLQFEKGSDNISVFLTEKDVEKLKSAIGEIEEFFKVNSKVKEVA